MPPGWIQGSHLIYEHLGVPENINLQPHGRQAKTYQVAQVVRIVAEYNLRLEA